MYLPSASGIDRAIACDAASVLPVVRSSGRAAETGTAVHGAIEQIRERAEKLAVGDVRYEDALEAARLDVLAPAPLDADWRLFVEGIDLSLIPRGAESEVMLAWDPTTGIGRRLTQPGVISVARDYEGAGARLEEFVGTADILGVVGGDTVFVADWKTGMKRVAARDSWQLKFLSLAAAKASGVRRAVAALIYLRDDGSAYLDLVEWGARELGGFAAQLRALVARIARAADAVDAGKVPSASLGSWCSFCQAAAACPAVTGAVQHLVPWSAQPTVEEVRARVMAMPPERVAEAYRTYEVLKGHMRWMGEALEAYARQSGGVDLGDGRVLQEVRTVKREIDGRVAERVLKEKFPELAGAVTYEPLTSQTAIKGELRKLKRKQKEVDAVVEEITKAGGVIKHVSTPVKAVRAGEVEVPASEHNTPALRVGGSK